MTTPDNWVHINGGEAETEDKRLRNNTSRQSGESTFLYSCDNTQGLTRGMEPSGHLKVRIWHSKFENWKFAAIAERCDDMQKYDRVNARATAHRWACSEKNTDEDSEAEHLCVTCRRTKHGSRFLLLASATMNKSTTTKLKSGSSLRRRQSARTGNDDRDTLYYESVDIQFVRSQRLQRLQTNLFGEVSGGRQQLGRQTFSGTWWSFTEIFQQTDIELQTDAVKSSDSVFWYSIAVELGRNYAPSIACVDVLYQVQLFKEMNKCSSCE